MCKVKCHVADEKLYVCKIECCVIGEKPCVYEVKCHIIGEKPYVCEVEGCGKRFTEYSSLYKHNVVHTQAKPYACEHCGKNYRQTSTLAMHKRTAHGEKIDATTPVMFGIQCEDFKLLNIKLCNSPVLFYVAMQCL